jgi:PPOX class probable FMN-dependent enzyme
MDYVVDVDGLERAVGSRLLPAMLKSIDHLDQHCETLLACSAVAVVGYTDHRGDRRVAAIGGEPGFSAAESDGCLGLPVPDDAAPGTAASTLFLLPGWRETLRINGRLDPRRAQALVVEEAFVHCGKAVIRSSLWDEPASQPELVPDSGRAPLDASVRAFIASSPFVVLTSDDGSGSADASPKGDPPGFIHVLDDTTLAIPDRRGNRRTDTFHNILEEPELALLALVPGDDRVLEVVGTARVTDDELLRSAMAMKGRTPHAALVLEVRTTRLTSCPAISAAGLWDQANHVSVDELPKAGNIWSDHVKANRTGGLKATAIRTAMNGSVVQAGAEMDYQRHLY